MEYEDRKLITSSDVRERWTLHHCDSGEQAGVGDILEHRGERYVLVGGREPLHAASTGRVWVRRFDTNASASYPVQEFFPSVFDCEWQDNDEGESA